MSELALVNIRIDGGTQPRSKIDEALVAEYASAMEGGAKFPEIAVFFDGVDHWLADGFHRYHAANNVHIDKLDAAISNGTRRDAVLHSVGANTGHGQRRTNEDKRRAVLIVLSDAEWVAWSDHEIARRCDVHPVFVGDMRRGYRKRSAQSGLKSILVTDNSMEKTRTFTHHKTGQPTTMRTENIGRRSLVDSMGRNQTLRVGQLPEQTRVEQIKTLVDAGNYADQIGEQIGVSEQQVRKIARKNDIKLAEHAAGGSRRRIDNRRVIEQTVLELDAGAASLRTIGISLVGIEPSEATAWAASMAVSLRAFHSLRKKLLEHANGKA